MRKLTVGLLAVWLLWPVIPAGAVECSPGQSSYPRRISPALLPPYPNPPFRVFAGWATDPPQYTVGGIRDVDNTWYAELTVTTSGAMVHGEHQANDAGFQAGTGTDGSARACVHAGGQTVDERI